MKCVPSVFTGRCIMYIMYINVAEKTISMRKDYIICSDLIMMPVFILFFGSDVSSSLNSTYI